MTLCPENVFGYDVDVLFMYRTPVVVGIKDRRLGILNRFFMVAILVYVLGYQIVYKSGYLLISAPAGGFRFSLREPTIPFGCDPILDDDCSSLVGNPKLSPVCTQYNGTDNDVCEDGEYYSRDGLCMKQRPCKGVDYVSAGVSNGNEFFLATRMVQTLQKSNCPINSLECDGVGWETDDNQTTDFYVSGIENYTLLIDHATRDASGNVGIGNVARNMKGVLKIPNNDKLCEKLSKEDRLVSDENGEETNKAPCYVESGHPQAERYDVFTIEEWIGAADLTLDDFANNKPGESVRARGHIIVINIEYSNIQRWFGASATDIRYVISVSYLDSSTFKHLSKIEDITQHRIVRKSYGLNLVLLQTGNLGVFDFNILVLQVAGGMALLSSAAVLTDFLAMSVLPERNLYRKAKYKETADFGDLRKARLDEHDTGLPYPEKEFHRGDGSSSSSSGSNNMVQQA